MSSKKQKLLVIDGNALVHRAFHALPPTMTDAQGRPTNAVYGFTTIFLKAIKDLKPDYVAACFDMKAKTFRHEQFDGYKATRTKAPDELYGQIPLVKEVLGVFGVPVFELSGFEADDLIGTICALKSVDRPDIDSIILTGDQDCLQLVDYNTFVLTPHKGLSETMLYGEEEVKFKFGGLLPKQLIDYKGIRGDVSDNIPGVKGIGEKGAIELLNNFGSLENIYKNIDSPKIKDRTRELLKTHEKEALMSKELATIIRDAKIDFVLKDCRLDGIDQTAILDLFQELGFKRLMSQVATMAKSGLIKVGGQNSLFDLVAEKVTGKQREEAPAKIEHKNIGKQDYRLITEENIDDFLKELKGQDQFCFDTETDRLSGVASNLVGISFCYYAGTAYYLPVAEADGIKKELIKIFTDPKIKKIGHNLKYDIEVMRRYLGEDVEGIYFDTMVASYLLNAGHRQHSLDTLAFVEFGYQMQPIEELIGTGKNQISMKDVAVEKASWYAGEDADLTYRLFEKYLPEIEKANLGVIFNDLEMPLIKVLAEIERNGVKINSEQLGEQSEEFGKEIKKIEKKARRIGQMLWPVWNMRLMQVSR